MYIADDSKKTLAATVTWCQELFGGDASVLIIKTQDDDDDFKRQLWQ